MRRMLFALLLVLVVPVAAYAAPFAVADSYTTGVIPDTFRVALDGAAEVVSPAFSGTMSDGTVLTNTLHFDVGAVTVGAHSLTVKACKDRKSTRLNSRHSQITYAPFPLTSIR